MRSNSIDSSSSPVLVPNKRNNYDTFVKLIAADNTCISILPIERKGEGVESLTHVILETKHHDNELKSLLLL